MNAGQGVLTARVLTARVLPGLGIGENNGRAQGGLQYTASDAKNSRRACCRVR